MIAVPAAPDLPHVMLRAGRLVVRDLVAVVVTSAIMTVLIVPLVLGAVGDAPALVLAGSVSSALALVAGAIRGASTELGERPRLATLRRVDPVLTLLVAAPLGGGAVLVTSPDPVLVAAGCAMLAVTFLLAPPAAAYGALRGRRGVAAARGGLLLAIARPGAALTVLATTVILAFGVVATAGVGMLVAPGAASVLAVCAVGRALDDLAPGWRP